MKSWLPATPVKLVNDLCVHLVGDTCLKLMRSTLAAECHRATDFAARYCWEKFALFAERVRSTIQKIILEIGNLRHPVTASMGIAEANGASMLDTAMLVAQADRCLYAAKAAGRNRAVNTASEPQLTTARVAGTA